MAGWNAVFKREFAGYFATPVALVFIVIFLVLAGVFTFELGGFFNRGQADLRPFFDFHPWLYLFLVPAVAMRLWAEERRTGTMELLLTLPIAPFGAVLGKFLAAWAFVGLALALTFPIWWSVNFLGEPDNGAIFSGYVGSLLMAGGFLAIGSVMSACTKSQVVAFILTIVVCLVLLLAGLGPVVNFIKGWMPAGVVDAITGLSFLTRFENISRGVIELRDVLYFVSLMGVSLVVTTWVLESKRH
ncbi:ABC transporter permease [Phycisphaerae bacterium]|nr:ABC transporter permease [Phycisphaerae bacterium]